jgi:hypothetical protein
MLLCFGFVTYAALEGFDRRILHLSDPQRRCAALGLCGACIKYAPVPCGLAQTFHLILPALLVVAWMLAGIHRGLSRGVEPPPALDGNAYRGSDAEPLPMITPACSTIAGTGPSSRI